jgi:hypothetical protein
MATKLALAAPLLRPFAIALGLSLIAPEDEIVVNLAESGWRLTFGAAERTVASSRTSSQVRLVLVLVLNRGSRIAERGFRHFRGRGGQRPILAGGGRPAFRGRRSGNWVITHALFTRCAMFTSS